LQVLFFAGVGSASNSFLVAFVSALAPPAPDFAAQSFRSVTQPVRIFVVLICEDVHLIEQRLVAPSRRVSADFTDALVDEATDIPELKVFGERRL
jgi:hypothetical protein